jgi:hypothetical protein
LAVELSVVLEVVSTSGTAVQFDDVEVVRLTGLGAEAESLLSEGFAEVSCYWVFRGSWGVSTTSHSVLDLRSLANLTLNVEYNFEMLA